MESGRFSAAAAGLEWQGEENVAQMGLAHHLPLPHSQSHHGQFIPAVVFP